MSSDGRYFSFNCLKENTKSIENTICIFPEKLNRSVILFIKYYNVFTGRLRRKHNNNIFSSAPYSIIAVIIRTCRALLTSGRPIVVAINIFNMTNESI